MKTTKFILVGLLFLIFQNVYPQVGTIQDAIQKRRIKKIESRLTYKTITINDTEIKCQRSTEKQRHKLSKNSRVIKAITNIELHLEKCFVEISKNTPLEKEPNYLIEREIKEIQRYDLRINTSNYLSEYNAYLLYYQNELNNPKYYTFKTISINDTVVKCQRTTKDNLQLISKDSRVLEAIKNTESLLEKCSRELSETNFLEEKPSYQIKNEIEDIQRYEQRINTSNYSSEYNAYLLHYRNQLDNAEYYLYLVKKNIKNNETEQALKNLKKYSSSNQQNTNNKELEAKVHFLVGLNYIEQGKKEFSYNGWNDGRCFYKSLEHLANSYSYGFDRSKISAAIQKIDSIAKQKEESIRSFDETNLHKISTSFQKNNSLQIKNLKKTIKQEESNSDKSKLLDLYKKLLELEWYHFKNGKFQGWDYKQAKMEKAKLEIEAGDLSLGCAQLYDTDCQYFGFYYASGKCKSWFAKRKEIAEKEYEQEEKEKARQWRKKNPKLIKLRSLLGEGFETVKAYLGTPLSEDYRINIGSRIHGSQYIGKKYKNKDGVYEIEFKSGHAVLVRFTPSKYIKYSPTKLSSESSPFDIEPNTDGACFGNEKHEHIGKTQIFSIVWDCSENDNVKTSFYGLNGKVISVVAY